MAGQRAAVDKPYPADGTPKRDVPATPRWSVPRSRLAVPEPLEQAVELGLGGIIVICRAGRSRGSRPHGGLGDRGSPRGPTVWVGLLGSDDNDPATLWATLLGALRDAVSSGAVAAAERGAAAEVQADAAHVREALKAMRAPATRAVSAFVGRLARVLQEVPYPIWLLLDDVHLVRDPADLDSLRPAHAVGALAAAHRPRRAPTPPSTSPAAPLKARCATSGTASCASCPRRRRPCSPPGVPAHLHAAEPAASLTEGWAAGLGWPPPLRTGRDVDHSPSFAGDTGAMAGYLIEEVLAGLDHETLDFMLVTCVAERLTPELAQRLSGRDDAGEILGKLADANTLVSVTTGSLDVPVPLRCSAASARLKNLGRTRFRQPKTATWFSEHGLDAEALEHAVVSQDEHVAHTMLHRYGVRLVLSGRGSTVGRALEGAPASVRAERPMEALAAIVALDSATCSPARSRRRRRRPAVVLGGDPARPDRGRRRGHPARGPARRAGPALVQRIRGRSTGH